MLPILWAATETAPYLYLAVLAAIGLARYCQRKPGSYLAFTFITCLLQGTIANLTSGYHGISSLSSYPDDILIATYIVVHLRNKSKRYPKSLPWLLCVFILAGGVSSYINAPRFLWVQTLLGAWSETRYWLLFMAVASTRLSEFERCRFLGVFLSGGILVGISGIVEMVAPASLSWTKSDASDHHISGITDHPLVFAGCMTILFAISTTHAYLQPSASPRITAAASGMLIVITMKVKEIAALPLIIAVAAWKARGLSKAIVALLLSGVVTATLALTGIFDQIVSKVLLYTGDTSDTQARNRLMATAWDLAASNFPLGVGFGQFGSAPSLTNYETSIFPHTELRSVWGLSRDYHPFVSDTTWATILGESGILGSLAFVAMLGLLIHLLWTSPPQTDPQILPVAITLVIASVVESLARAVYFDAFSLVALAAFCGIAAPSNAAIEAGQGIARQGSLTHG